MKQIQMKLDVFFHKVKLEVRFPCSIIAVLRIENEDIQWRKEPPLKLKEAIIQQSVSHKFYVYYNTQKGLFSEKKISIILFLKSSSGKISAGSSVINLNQLKPGINKISLPVEKCPDKNAFIQLQVSYQNLSQLQVVQTQTNIHIPDIMDNSQSLQSFTLRRKDQKSKQLSDRQNKSKQTMNIYQSTGAFQNNGPKLRFNDIKSPNKQKQKENDLLNQVRYLRIELQKEEIKSNRSKNQPTSPKFPPHQAPNLKAKNNQLQRQIKNLQKKIDHLQLQNKSITSQKDALQKKSKQLQFQFKIIKQKYQDIYESHDNTIKKNEFKENYYKDQIKALSDKLSLSQSEKQRMIFDKNDLVNDFQQRQKQLRSSMKDREKVSNDQKTRLTKKIQQLVKQLEQYQFMKDQAQSKVQSVNTMLSSQLRNQKSIASANQQLSKQISTLKLTIKEHKDTISQMQQLNAGKLQIEEEKKKLKKKLNEAEQQNINLSKNAVVLQTTIQKLSKRIEELQLALKDKNNEGKSMLREQETRQKQIQNLKKLIQQKQKKIEQMVQKKQKQNQKSQQNIQQLKRKQLKSQQQLKKLRQQLKQRENKLKRYESQIQDHTDIIESNNQKIKALQFQLNQQKIIINRKKYESQQILSQKNQLDLEIQQLQFNLQIVSKQLKDKENSFKTQLNNKNSQLISIKQSLNRLQLRSRSNDQQLSYKIDKLQLQITDKTEVNKQLLQKIKVLNENIYELQIQKNKKGSNVQDLQYKIKLHMNQISFLKRVNQKNSEEINQSNINNKELKNQIQGLKHNIDDLNALVSQLQCEIQELNFNNNNSNDQFNVFKEFNRQNLFKFLKSITGQGCISLQPDHQQVQIKLLMKQAISNINTYVASKDKQIGQLNSDLNDQISKNNDLSEEIEAARKQYQNLTVQYNQLLTQLNNLNSNSASNNSKLTKQIQSLNKQINSLKEQLIKTQLNLQKKQKECLSLIGQSFKKSQQIQTSLGINTRLKDDIKKLQQNIIKLNNQIKDNKLKQQQLKSIIKQMTQKSKNSTKQQKQYEKQASKKIFQFQGQIKKKNLQIEKLNKQIQKKAEIISNKNELNSKLRAQLDEAKIANINLLKENQKINNKNQKSNFYTTSLQQQINNLKIYQKSLLLKVEQLEKNVKEKGSLYFLAKEETARQAKEIAKHLQDIEKLNQRIKGNQQIIKRQLLDLTKNQQQFKKLNAKLLVTERQSGSMEIKLKKQLQIQKQQKAKKQKEFNSNKERYQISLYELQRQKLQNQKQIKQLKIVNKGLDDQVIQLTKNLSEKERKNYAEDHYLKPMRDNIEAMKGYVYQYSRVGDNFQGNKNKLMKLSATKVQQFTQRTVFDRVKDVSFAYNKLKLFMLSSQTMNQQMKADIAEEMKKVQIPLDRILRGDK